MKPTVTIYLVQPNLAAFDPSVAGVSPILPDGTEVSPDDVDAVRAAARREGVSVSTRRPRR